MIDRKIENNQKNNFFVLLFDSLWDNPIGRKPNYLAVFLFILSNASKKDYSTIINNEKFIVRRGQWLGSLLKIAKQFYISIGTVSNIVKYLKSESIIETKTTNKFTLFTVLNYDKYQPTLENKIENKLKTNRKQIETKDNVYNVNNILSKDNIGKAYGNEEINFILSSYKKYIGFKPTDRRPRFVANSIRANIKRFIEDAKPYRQYSFNEVVEKSFAWYVKTYELKGDTLDVVRRKLKKLFELTLNKLKGGEKV